MSTTLKACAGCHANEDQVRRRIRSSTLRRKDENWYLPTCSKPIPTDRDGNLADLSWVCAKCHQANVRAQQRVAEAAEELDRLERERVESERRQAEAEAATRRRTVQSNCLIVNGCGFKPSVETVMGFLEHLDFLYMLRRSPDTGIVLPKSSKIHYAYHEAVQRQDASWNDGLFLRGDEEGRTALVRHIAAVTSRACNVLGLKRERAVRSFHAMRH